MRIEQVPAYELISQEELKDIHSTGYLLRHKKTQARVMLIENDDDNKVFDITFKTPPKDSTGVAHILEHSVLCGSKHFPLKDPFVELVKGSLNTFLNAMTYPDKTTYPVASCNAQDFQNLLHVYLDAVFYPNIYDREEIFRQEGWSWHLDDADGELTYNGVVYNEMKGVFSSPDDVLERKIMDGLFPDTSYGRESGGDPEVIPELTYEEFLDFHRSYYHPSNSYLYLYGDMDMAEKLNFIDREYLSHFEYLELDASVALQKPFDGLRTLRAEYPVSEAESLTGTSYLSYNIVTGDPMDSKKSNALSVLDYALLSAPGAPLKQALLDAKLAKDIYGSYSDGIRQPYFTIIAKGTDEEKQEEFLTIIHRTLERLAADGIDKKALEAAINNAEFNYREADFATYPKGLIYGLDILDNWLYSDENPFAAVKLSEVFRALRAELSTDYFEALIRECLLENPHSLSLTLVPKKGLAAERDRQTAEKLQKYRDSLTRQQREDLAAQTKALEEYQEEPEDPEVLRRIPQLHRDDIGKKTAKFYNKEVWMDDTLLLHHDIFTNGISYLELLFDLKQIPAEWIPYLGLLKAVLGSIDTEHYTYGELFNEINARTGGIGCSVEVFDKAEGTDFVPLFGIRAKALAEQTDFVFRMIEEILDFSKFDDEKRLYEILAQLKMRAQTSLVSAGHSTAVLRAASYCAPVSAYQDRLGGVAYYRFLEELEGNFEAKKAEISAKLKELMNYVFRAENLTVSYTGEADGLEKLRSRLPEFLGHLRTCAAAKEPLSLVCEKKNEGFQTSGQVQYVGQAGNFAADGFSYTGALGIVKVILSYDYLWTNIRVKGGAYGCMCRFKRNGESYFASYRDPNLRRTLEVFRGVPEYLRGFSADEREMTKYIIGAISALDVPKTARIKGQMSCAAYFAGLTEETMQRERDEILQAQPEDIRALAGLIEAVLQKEQICVVGGEEAIEKEQELFDNIEALIR